jgi:hypothetical protein
VNEAYTESIEEAIIHETSSVDNLDNGISVMCDARHGWRKNSKDTSVVVIGDNSHKVLCHQLVTKTDDAVTQRHETVGTRAVMDMFDEKNIGIHMWIHDRNMSINKLVNDRYIINQNDLWHGVRNLKKAMSKVMCGAKKYHGQTWHFELDDKLNSIANHVYYAAKASNGDADSMRQRLDTIVPHYKNQHSNCPAESRCKVDEKYEPTKKVITDPKAEKLLTDALHSTILYKNTKDFSFGKDSHYVESFNNVLNVFGDKRINFSSSEYEKRAKLAVLHWNENVDRGYTSTWHKPTAANRRAKTKKVYKRRVV